VKALVTGGSGFIGHHLVRSLVERGVRVVVLDDLSTGDRSRLALVDDQIVFLEGSVLDRAALDVAVAGCDAVFHLAAVTSVARSLDDPLLTNAVNVTGTVEVMSAAARAKVGRVVLAGSSAVYGASATLPCHEGQLLAPLSPYGVSKLAAEQYVHVLGRLHGVGTVVLRYFNVFGPGQDPRSEYAAVIPAFVTAALGGRRPTINGDGGISRDFVYVSNVVEANLRAVAASTPTGLTCNVAGGARTSLLELLEAIGASIGRRIEPIVGPAREGDILHSEADITLARGALGYEVEVPFREGIRRTVAWYRDVSTDPAPPARGETALGA
jgi:UDP-glucose 4-epimerase